MHFFKYLREEQILFDKQDAIFQNCDLLAFHYSKTAEILNVKY